MPVHYRTRFFEQAPPGFDNLVECFIRASINSADYDWGGHREILAFDGKVKTALITTNATAKIELARLAGYLVNISAAVRAFRVWNLSNDFANTHLVPEIILTDDDILNGLRGDDHSVGAWSETFDLLPYRVERGVVDSEENETAFLVQRVAKSEGAGL